MNCYELCSRLPRFSKLHYPLAIAGWVLVMGLMLYATVIDIVRT